MKTNAFIFDFDGTLIDSFYTLVDAINHLADEYHFRKVQPDEIEHLRTLTSRDFLKFLQIPFYRVPKVVRAGRQHLRSKTPSLVPFDNLVTVLKQLRTRQNILLGIITSNSTENVKAWLARNQLEGIFDFIHGEQRLFGKKRILRKIIKTHHIPKNQAFYIGDETRDIEAAKKAGVSSIAVTWGFSAETILAKYQPDFMLHTPADLLTLYLTKSPSF